MSLIAASRRSDSYRADRLWIVLFRKSIAAMQIVADSFYGFLTHIRLTLVTMKNQEIADSRLKIV